MTVYQLYIEAIDIEPLKRESFVRSKTNDETVINEVLMLLTTDKTSFTLSSQIAKESDFYQQLNTLKVGDVISVYELTENLGEGGMGTVFKAKRIDGRFEQTVAIKIIPSFFYNSHIINEAHFMAKLSHANICSVNDAGITGNDLHYIVMEYIDGCNITAYIKKENITLNETLTVFLELCVAVNYAHQMQIIHGDLKPENILVDRNNQIKVLDFGIAQILHHDLSPPDGEIINIQGISKGFSSPEMIKGDKPSVYSDIYALGKLLITLFEHINIPKKDYQEVMSIIDKATALSPTERYASVSELHRDLLLYVNGHVVTAYHPSQLYKLKKFVFNRHPISTSIGLLFTTSLLVLVINLIFQYQQLNSEKKQTDVMLEQFTLVLDLDFDKKSSVELSLANSYESRGEDEKAIILYKKIISRIDKLTDTDIAFNAGTALLTLYSKQKKFNLIHPAIKSLEERFEFIPNTETPSTAAQAFLYHYLINMSYPHDDTITDGFLFHMSLIKDIQERYHTELTNHQKSVLKHFLSNKKNLKRNSLNFFYFNKHEQNKLTLIFNYIGHVFSELFDPMHSQYNNFVVNEGSIRHFIELKSIYVGSTHLNRNLIEANPKVVFQDGIFKAQSAGGVYEIKNNKLTFDNGEGMEQDQFLYLSESLALTVPLETGDLVLLSYDDLRSKRKSTPWLEESLLSSTWYHLYDRASEYGDPVLPTLMEIEFGESDATLKISDNSTTVPWRVNDKGALELHFGDDKQSLVELIQVRKDQELLLIKNNTSGALSFFTKDQKLADHLLYLWQSAS